MQWKMRGKSGENRLLLAGEFTDGVRETGNVISVKMVI